MTIQELVDKIYNFFIETYQLRFNGLIEVHRENGFYDCKIYLNEQHYIPMHIMTEQESDEEFLKYIYKELYKRKLYLHDAYKFTSINLTKDQL